MEKKILQALKFKIPHFTLYEELFIKLRQLMAEYPAYKQQVKDQQEFEVYLSFLTKLVMHDVDFAMESKSVLAIALLGVGLNYFAKQETSTRSRKESNSGS